MKNIVAIPLRKIIRDPRCQPRVNAIDSEHVEEMREAKAEGAKFPPVVVYREQFSMGGPENFYLSEGFHRFEVFDLDAEETIEAEVRDGSIEEAIINSMASNVGHGLKRTKGDGRKAIETMIAMCPDWSDRRIADHVKLSFSYVSSIRRNCVAPHTSTQSEPTVPVVRVGADGKKREYATKPVDVSVETVAEVRERVEKSAETKPQATQTATATSFDWKEWKKNFGSLVRLLDQAAGLAGVKNGKEHGKALTDLDGIQKFIVTSLQKAR